MSDTILREYALDGETADEVQQKLDNQREELKNSWIHRGCCNVLDHFCHTYYLRNITR